jgi:predicted PurR-regulated permease PerM
MEILAFTANAIIIYLLTDWIIRTIEKKRGEALKQRQAVFLVVILVLALISFRALRMVFSA